MRENSVQLIKYSGTWTVSSPGIKSIGLRADALAPSQLNRRAVSSKNDPPEKG